jgi:hypothetical protein
MQFAPYAEGDLITYENRYLSNILYKYDSDFESNLVNLKKYIGLSTSDEMDIGPAYNLPLVMRT